MSNPPVSGNNVTQRYFVSLSIVEAGDNMASALAFFGLWRGVIGTAVAVAVIYFVFKLSQLADSYREKIQRGLDAARDLPPNETRSN
jgi:hypothetical protein